MDKLYSEICEEAEEITDKQTTYSIMVMDEYQAQYEYNLFKLAYERGYVVGKEEGWDEGYDQAAIKFG